MKSKTRSLARVVGLVALCGGAAYLGNQAAADGIPPSPTMYYSGFLEEAGSPVTGSRRVTVSFWSDETSGTMLCETVVASALFDAGSFRIPLADACTDVIREQTDVWTEVDVGGEVLPRTRIGAVPYAVEAERAGGASGAFAQRQTWSTLIGTRGEVQIPRPASWIAGAAYVGAGDTQHYVVNFAHTFSPIPACTANIVSGAGIANCEVSSVTGTSAEVWCRLNSTNQAADGSFFLICIGD